MPTATKIKIKHLYDRLREAKKNLKQQERRVRAGKADPPSVQFWENTIKDYIREIKQLKNGSIR